jgi:hypothetical protein
MAPLTELTEDVVPMVLELAEVVPPFGPTNPEPYPLDCNSLLPPLSPLALCLSLELRDEVCVFLCRTYKACREKIYDENQDEISSSKVVTSFAR